MPGLNIELRLRGRSASCRLGDSHRLTLDAGETPIVGEGEGAVWEVHLPHQPALETVSLHFTEAFLAERASAGDPLVSAVHAWVANCRVRTTRLEHGLRPSHRMRRSCARPLRWNALPDHCRDWETDRSLRGGAANGVHVQ
ncbi:hypothetical protein [uncultured Roseovarius sp.]|uniref:hypothetical protein n=1 Tax=uncultured Roseovarius sp. TaxID=293344 RepID=UPI0026042839|nr:hypothetical protein [uncultured Roseovarius sp.]